jgi:hypothetical protein
MSSKKRPARISQSPMARMTQEFGDALIETEAPSSLGEKESSSQQYCTPEYLSGDFCTPEDQMQELRWSQKDQNEAAVKKPNTPCRGTCAFSSELLGLTFFLMSQQPATYVCPPTPESSKRRKTRTQSKAATTFLYDLDSLPEEQEDSPQKMPPPPSKTPTNRSNAPAKPQKQKTLQVELLQQFTATARHEISHLMLPVESHALCTRCLNAWHMAERGFQDDQDG